MRCEERRHKIKEEEITGSKQEKGIKRKAGSSWVNGWKEDNKRDQGRNRSARQEGQKGIRDGRMKDASQ